MKFIYISTKSSNWLLGIWMEWMESTQPKRAF